MMVTRRSALCRGSHSDLSEVSKSQPRITFHVLQVPSPAANLDCDMTAFLLGASLGRGFALKMASMLLRIARCVWVAVLDCARPKKSSMSTSE